MVIPEDLAKAFRNVVTAADIWCAVGRELDILPDGQSIDGVCVLTADYGDDMPPEVCSLLTDLAGKLRVPAPVTKTYREGAQCLLHIKRALIAIS
jgi:hypothetical protein